MPGVTMTTLPSPSRESKLVWFDGGGAVVVVPFPESEFPLSLADADADDPDPDSEAVFDGVVFVPDCDLVSVPDVVVFPVADVVLAVVVAEFDEAVLESVGVA
jgi:hypothetical protein